MVNPEALGALCLNVFGSQHVPGICLEIQENVNEINDNDRDSGGNT